MADRATGRALARVRVLTAHMFGGPIGTDTGAVADPDPVGDNPLLLATTTAAGSSSQGSATHLVAPSAAAISGAPLDGKACIVTGAASGIGREAALLFAAAGAKGVVCVDWNGDGAEETAAAIRAAGSKAVARKADVSDEESAQSFVDLCVDTYGSLDVYFANAGVMGSLGGYADMNVDDFAATFRVNVIGVALGIKTAIAAMMRNSENGTGSIVCTASVAGLKSAAGGVDYSASKAAVISLVQTAAYDLQGSAIRVNGLAPGLTRSGMTQVVFDVAEARGSSHKIGQLSMLKRAAAPEEIARVALFLASDDASFITGQTIAICGGLTASHPYTYRVPKNRRLGN